MKIASQDTAGCFDRETLARYLHGLIRAPESSRVSLHLLDCPRCIATCESLPTMDDQLEIELRAIRNERQAGLSDVCNQMIDRIQHAYLVSQPRRAVSTAAQDETQDTIQQPTHSGRQGREIEPAKQFGRYTIQRRLGAGGMACVYLASDNMLGRLVAIKFPHSAIQSDPQARSRFQQEARAAAAVTHHNVCGVLDIGELDGLVYLTMPFLEGETLAERLKRQPPLELVEVLRIVCELATAVDAVHARGVVHRDIKPGNVYLTQDGRTVLMDFGLALATHQDSRLTETGLLMGTPAYLSPEQAAGDWTKVGPAADIYALGVVFHELLFGQVPFTGPPGVIIGKILHEAVPTLGSKYADCDARLIAICRTAMSRQPDQRYATGAALRAAVEQWQQSIQGRQSNKCNSSGKRAGLIVGAMVLLVLLAVIIFKLEGRWGSVELKLTSPPDQLKQSPSSPTPHSSPLPYENLVQAPTVLPTKTADPQPAISNGSLNGLDPGKIASEQRNVLAELNRLPAGLTWVACLEPKQLTAPAQNGTAVGKPLMASMNASGTTLAILHEGSTASIWDLATQTRRSLLPLPKNDTHVMLLSQNTRLLTTGGGWRIRDWDLTRSVELAAMPGHTNWINTLATDAAERIAASSSKDGTVRCWDLETHQMKWSQPHGSWTRSVAVSVDGRQVFSGGQDGLVKRWEAENGKLAGTLKGSNRPIIELRSAPNTNLIAVQDLDGGLSVWAELETEPKWKRRCKPGYNVRFDSSGKYLGCTSETGETVILDSATGATQFQLPKPSASRIWGIVGFATDEHHFVVRSSDDYLCVIRY